MEKAFRFRQKCLESKKHLTSKLSQYLTSLQQEISLKTNYIRENYSNSKDFTDDEEMEDEEIEDENNNITTFIDLTEDSNASSDVCLVENDSGFLEPSPVITANAHTSQQQQIAENIPVSFQLQTNINNSILLNDEKNCKYCNKKYQRKGFMANHVKKKHKIIPIPEVIHTPKPSIKHTPKRSINHTPEPSVEQKTLRENYLKDPTRFIFPLNRRSRYKS